MGLKEEEEEEEPHLAAHPGLVRRFASAYTLGYRRRPDGADDKAFAGAD